MLSQRATKTVSQLDIPWRFVPAKDRFDPEFNPNGLVSLATAENPLMYQELADFTARIEIPPAVFTYSYSSSGGPRLPAALATHLNETFNPFTEISASDVHVLAAATSIHSVLAFSLAEAGDAVLVSRPIYGRFELDFGNEQGVKIIYVDTAAEDSLNPGVIDAFEDALQKASKDGIKVRAVLIVNPSNPLGWCYPRETLVGLMGFCQSHNIHFISDEVYALSVFNDHLSSDSQSKGLVSFTSVLSIDTKDLIDPSLVHVEYGTSKDFAAAGLRLGALVTRNQDLQRAIRTVARFHQPSGPSVAIGAAIFEDRDWCRWFIALSRERIAKAYEFATSRLREIGIRYLEANAGFFVLIDLGPWLPPADGATQKEREFKLAEQFLEGDIFLHPGEEHALEPGRFRLVYTQREEIVEEGLRRLQAVLDTLPWQSESQQPRPSP